MRIKKLFQPDILIEDEKMLLRPITEEDKDMLLSLYGDERIYKYRPGMPRGTAALIEKMLEKYEEERVERKAVYLVACDKAASGCPVGIVEVFNTDARIEQVEIGYTILPDLQGRGYGKASVGTLTRYLLDECEVNRVIATVHVENIPSQKLLAGNGFTKEGVLREGAFWQGIGFVDICLFSRLKKDEA